MNMNFNNNELLLAKSKVANKRQRALDICEQYKDAIYKKIPNLIEIDNKIILCGTQYASYITMGEKEKGNEKKQELYSLEKEKSRLIVDAGFDLTLMTPTYSCKICNDKGICKGKICECVKEIIKQIKHENINKSSPLKLSSFNTFTIDKYPNEVDKELGVSIKSHMSDILIYCKDYAKYFSLENDNLIFMGSSGLGKTHLALAIANEVIDKGYSVIYVSAQVVFSKIEDEHFKDNNSDTINALINADLLIMDDLGTEFINPFVSATIYNLINSRMNYKRPTIYTTNILSQQLFNARYSEKITSRLLGNCETFHFCGKDIRLLDK